jgi:hypothetical protein
MSTFLVIREARSGLPIAVVNDVNLHSIYDPVKEATNFIKGQENLKENVLVLGLGLGYHINALKDHLLSKFKYPRIMVLDPNLDVTTKALELNNWGDDIEIICESNVSKLYDNREFVLFLNKHPTVLPHPASFNLYSDYFKRILSFRANDTFSEIRGGIMSNDLLHQLPQKGNLKDHLNYLKNDKKLDNFDYLMLAFKNMSKLYHREL